MSPISKSNEIINNHSIDFKGGNNADLLELEYYYYNHYNNGIRS